MLISSFFKPKWQHSDPAVRQAALTKLDPTVATDLVVIRTLSRDPVGAVRSAAIARLPADLSEFERLLAVESEAAVKEHLRTRIMDFLLGSDSPEILARITPACEPAMLEALLKKSPFRAVREQALNCVEREPLLEYVVIHDSEMDLKTRALARIQSEKSVERVIRQFRTTNKEMTRLAKERAQVLSEARLRPLETERMAKQIIIQMEGAMSNGYNPRLAADLELAEKQWQSLDPAPQPELTERYLAINTSVHALLIQHEQEEVERKQRAEQQAAILHQRNARLDQLSAYLNGFDLSPGGIPGIDSTTFMAGWQSLAENERNDGLIELPLDEQRAFDTQWQQLDKRWQQLDKRYSQALQLIRLYPERSERIRSASDGISRMLAAPRQVTEAELDAARRKVNALIPPAELSPLPEYEALVVQLAELEAHVQAHGRKSRAYSEELPTLLDELDQHLDHDNGDLNASQALAKRIRKRLDFLPEKHHTAWRSRFSRLMARIKELEDWQGFATHPKREALCAEMEALISAEIPPEIRAQLIKDMQDQWKALGKGEPQTTQALWARFHAAADQAYQPCREYQAQQARQRQENLARREAICEQIEAQLAWLKENTPDWSLLEAFIQQAYLEWRQCGPTDRRTAHQSGERFIQGINALKAVMHSWYQQNREDKERLIERLQTALSEAAPNEATDLAKAAQQEWRLIGPAGYKLDRALWKAFRKVSDAIFERRQQSFDARKLQAEKSMQEQSELLDRFEATLQSDDLTEHDLNRELQELQSAWQSFADATDTRDSDSRSSQRGSDSRGADSRGPEGRSSDGRGHGASALKPLENRLRKLTERARAKQQTFRHAQQELARCTDLTKAGLCDHYESLLLKERMLSAAQVATLLSAWQTAGTGTHTAETLLQPRFERLCAAQEMTPQDLSRWEKEGQAQGAVRADVCLDLEILADIPSPPELSDARMRRKVARLEERLRNAALTDQSELSALIARWYSTAFVAQDNATTLNARFARALEAILAKPQEARR